MNRVGKANYYLDIAQTVASRSTCLWRNCGAIIVKNDVIVSTGYNGAPRGRKNCSDIGYCTQAKLGIPKNERIEVCRALHAEANAIIAASREQMLDSTLYISCTDAQSGALTPGTVSCAICRRLIINAGITAVIIRDTEKDYRTINVRDWIFGDDSLIQPAN